MGSEHRISTWRKSSYSGAGDGQGGDNCLEVNDTRPHVVYVRDSKNPQGPALALPARTWAAFVDSMR
ncbi:hypothetical protein FHS39_000675 [Streptomyces olivoverticillatus]|uniref:DUF397 domain-containing protein n=1 Tax=Streptomyces olivoverticillatus TaxID=66427 RepID=A0A7W7LK35_9ACTN|nr:DUF397 domain-containing protein [Streptomyces olivoverticillatus]MBB4891675.1 hypothetical protein [Streptomyces olivoverticillatus]